MKIAVFGANGKIGKRVCKKLAQENHEVLAVLRKESQFDDFTKDHMTPVMGDLEGDISSVFEHNPNVVIFTAGSGGHTGTEKTLAVDLKGAQKTIDAAKRSNVDQYIMVSALGTNNADEAAEEMRAYFNAKSDADQYLVQSGLNYVILRPGRLTDETGSGNVQAGASVDISKGNDISRDNVATAIINTVGSKNLNQKVVELLDGLVPVKDALAAI